MIADISNITLGQAITTLIVSVIGICFLVAFIRFTIDEVFDRSDPDPIISEIVLGIWGALALAAVCILAYFFPEVPKV